MSRLTRDQILEALRDAPVIENRRQADELASYLVERLIPDPPAELGDDMLERLIRDLVATRYPYQVADVMHRVPHYGQPLTIRVRTDGRGGLEHTVVNPEVLNGAGVFLIPEGPGMPDQLGLGPLEPSDPRDELPSIDVSQVQGVTIDTRDLDRIYLEESS